MDTHQRVVFLVGPEQVELREVPVEPPGDGELLLRVDAATTCGTDVKVFRRGGHPRMLRAPCPFGHELSGTVCAVGAGVAGWREGDGVIVANSASCGQCAACRAGRENLCRDLHYLNGAYAELLTVPPRFVVRSTYRRPAGLDPALAALTEPLACVHHGLEACLSDDVDEAVVIGAGPIGMMFMAELARGGRRVVASDLDRDRLAIASELMSTVAAPAVGDGEDGARLRAATTDGGGAPLVIEATGVPAGWVAALEAVREGGTVVLFGGCAPDTTVPLDAQRVHYAELTVKGVYHHRPATVQSAIRRLEERPPTLAALISEEHPIEGVGTALRRMAERKILKAAIRPGGPASA